MNIKPANQKLFVQWLACSLLYIEKWLFWPLEIVWPKQYMVESNQEVDKRFSEFMSNQEVDKRFSELMSTSNQFPTTCQTPPPARLHDCTDSCHCRHSNLHTCRKGHQGIFYQYDIHQMDSRRDGTFAEASALCTMSFTVAW